MSLYIGNLDPRVHKEELERVFGRFGKCDIRLKDGYGFAIYGIRAQAEVAMRALRGIKICGLPISLSWSNKQPNAPQSFSRGARSHEMQQGRGFERRDDHMNGPVRSNARQHYKFRQPDADARRSKSKDLHVEKGSFDHVSEEREGDSKKEDGQDKSENGDNNLLESGRWGEFGRVSNDNHIDDGTAFERYNPDRDYERTDQEGGKLMIHDVSPRKETSDDKFKREEAVDVALGHQDFPRKNQACFKCGNIGHKIRDCPLQDTSRVRKLGHSNDRWDNVLDSRRRGRIELKGVEPSSRRRLSSTSTKERVRSRRDSGSERHQRIKRRRSSPISTEYKDNGKSHGRKKRSEDGNEFFKHHHGKRRRRSVSHSSASSYRSSSISRSSVSYSSSSLMSGSRLNRTKSRGVKTRSKSRSRSPRSRSLSESLGEPLSSPPNKTDMKLNGSVDNLQTKPDVMQESQLLEVVAEEGKTGRGDAGVDLQSNLVLMQENQQVEVVSKEENVALGDSEMVVQDEDMVACVDLQDDYDIDDLQKNDDEYLEEQQLIDVNSSPQVLGADNEPQTLGDESHVQMTSDSKTKSATRAKCATISMDELDRVMKHYNLKHTEEKRVCSSIEDYFGCARLWPWEILYYRRLKKGPISTENYARRLAQNKEFGITDKYVRSSSGWGEPIEELDTKE